MKEYMDYCEAAMQTAMHCPSDEKEKSFLYTGLSKLPENPVSAMAYVPFQIHTAMYEAEKALCRGTAFPDLDKPFLGGKCIR